MNCNEIRELLSDLAAGMNAATPEVEKHVTTCHDCAAHLRDLQKTMALLDEWQAPEPSPYFDTRLHVRLREEMSRPHATGFSAAWFSWLRRPAWALSLATVLFAGALLVGARPYLSEPATIATKPPSPGLPVEPGTAVGDLQALARNDELYADFDVLDDLQVQDDVTENP